MLKHHIGKSMDIKDIELLINESLQNPEDTAARGKYSKAISECLGGKKWPDTLVSIIVQGMDVDQGAGFYNYLQSASKANLQKVWKLLNQYHKENENAEDNFIKLIAGMLPLALLKKGNMESLCEIIMEKITGIFTPEKVSQVEIGSATVILDSVGAIFQSRLQLPKWSMIDVSSAAKQKFSELLLSIINETNEGKYREIKEWANAGVRYAEEQAKIEKIEEKIPASRIAELRDIAYHYQLVEEQNRKNLYAIAELEETNSKLNKRIETLQTDKENLNRDKYGLQKELDNKIESLGKAENRIGELEQTIKAFDSIKENEVKKLFDDVANELQSIYQDFAETESDDMDLVLGCIYREKLKDIFRILEKKGIRLEQ